MSENNIVRWTQLVWFVGAILTAMYFIGNAVVSNDRLRAVEDQRIESSFGCKLDNIQKDITDIKVCMAKLGGK